MDSVNQQCPKTVAADLNRRIRIYRISSQALMRFLSLGKIGYKNLLRMELPLIPEMPEGAEFIAMRENFATQSIEIIARHATFATVPEGGEVPAFSGGWVVCAETLVFSQEFDWESVGVKTADKPPEPKRRAREFLGL